MKTQLSGTLNVPASGIPAVGEPVNALTEQVNNLQRRYYRSLASDCEAKTKIDKWYIATIASLCATFIFPLCIIVVLYCYFKARKNKKGGIK